MHSGLLLYQHPQVWSHVIPNGWSKQAAASSGCMQRFYVHSPGRRTKQQGHSDLISSTACIPAWGWCARLSVCSSTVLARARWLNRTCAGRRAACRAGGSTCGSTCRLRWFSLLHQQDLHHVIFGQRWRARSFNRLFFRHAAFSSLAILDLSKRNFRWSSLKSWILMLQSVVPCVQRNAALLAGGTARALNRGRTGVRDVAGNSGRNIEDWHGAADWLAEGTKSSCEAWLSPSSREWLRVRIAMGPGASSNASMRNDLLRKAEEEEVGIPPASTD